MDTGRAISGFYFHRLLCRVFSRPDSPFLLKGGQSMLARTPDARATRDLDLLAESGDLEGALAELRELASIDLNDFVTFEFVEAQPIKAEDEYRSGFKVSFVPMLGPKRMQRISVDLVADQIPCGEPEVLAPADRIDLDGVPVFDYRIYPLANSISDKLCAILETHDGRPSSRVKDLVDVLIYIRSEDFDGSELCGWVELEARARGICLPSRFSVPEAWRIDYATSYRKMVGQTGLPSTLADLAEGERLAAAFFDLVLSGAAMGLHWSCDVLAWAPRNVG